MGSTGRSKTPRPSAIISTGTGSSNELTGCTKQPKMPTSGHCLDSVPRENHVQKILPAPLTRMQTLLYCVSFFALYGGVIVALRLVDASWDFPGTDAALQRVYDWRHSAPWLSNHRYFGGAVAFLSFLCSCILFTFLDVFRAPSKIQKDWWPSAEDMWNAGAKQNLIYIVGNLVGYLFAYDAIELPEEAPRVCVLFEQVLVAFLVGDFLIYWEHRVMHTIPYLRKNIHSWHHHYHIPFSWAGGIVHPLEDLVVIGTQVAAPISFQHHPFSFWVFAVLWVHLLVEEHSGHDLFWAPYHWMPFARCACGSGAKLHDIHHYKVTKNYGFVLGVWDHLFDTAEPVPEVPDVPSNRFQTWWEFDKVRRLAKKLDSIEVLSSVSS